MLTIYSFGMADLFVIPGNQTVKNALYQLIVSFIKNKLYRNNLFIRQSPPCLKGEGAKREGDWTINLGFASL